MLQVLYCTNVHMFIVKANTIKIFNYVKISIKSNYFSVVVISESINIKMSIYNLYIWVEFSFYLQMAVLVLVDFLNPELY